MASNSLSPSSLAIMVSSLPRATATPVEDEYDAIALFIHACMVAVGFRLVGLGEDDRTGLRRQPSELHQIYTYAELVIKA
jgi:hypothetical protein